MEQAAAGHAPSAAYVPCPTLDQMYSQRGIGPTPFASPMTPNAASEAPRIVAVADKRPKAALMDCKMTYPIALRSAHEPKQAIHTPRTESNFFVENPVAHGAHSLPQSATDTAQPANIFWQIPPPVYERKPDPLHEQVKLPRDTLHPLLSALQGAENAKAAQFTPQVAYLANASRRGPPCPAHRVTGQSGQSGPAGSGERADETMGDGDGDFDVTTVGVNRMQRMPRKGDNKTAIGRAYNSEGGYQDPDQYASRIIEFASTQPSTLTAIAAKALASAIHDNPSHTIPCNVAKARAQRPVCNSGPSGTNANRHEFAGLGDESKPILPPSAAFRHLSEALRSTLSKRERDCRHKVADILAATHVPLQPPPIQPDEKVDVREVQYESSVFANRKAPHVDEDDEEELDYVSDGETDAVAALGPSARLSLWNLAMRRKPRRRGVADTGAHVAEAVTAGRRLKVLTPQLVSLHTSLSSRAQVSTYLAGVGIRMENALSQTKPPSQSSFLQASQKLQAIHQFTNMASTPSNSFDFDDQRLEMLLADKGEEVEEIFLEGCTHLADATFATIGRYCPNLRLLNLADCVQLSDKTACQIFERCTQLAYVNISGCEKLSGAAIASVMENCPDLFALCAAELPLIDKEASIAFTRAFQVKHLAVLDLSYCINLTDEALVCVAQHCRGLEMLDISGCRSVGDVGVGSIGSSCSCLKVLKLKLCSQLTTASLKTLTLAARNLTSLDIAGCIAMNPATLTDVVKHMPCAQALGVGGCPLLDDSAVTAITRCCKNLKSLNLASCVGVSLASCMELIHELTKLRRLVVSESSISNAEVVMLSALRESCRIVRNQHREVPEERINAYRMAEAKKKKKVEDPKKKKK